MTKYYLPVETINDYTCYVVYDSQTIRAYYNQPTIGTNLYTDFYVNTHYMQKEGSQEITNSIELPVCLSSDNNTKETNTNICAISFL